MRISLRLIGWAWCRAANSGSDFATGTGRDFVQGTSAITNRAGDAINLATSGRPYSLGATVSERGVNFSLFSPTAEGAGLLLFDREDAAKPSRLVHSRTELRSGPGTAARDGTARTRARRPLAAAC
jgi:hypothetical protein